jgi:hypothetical protein
LQRVISRVHEELFKQKQGSMIEYARNTTVRFLSAVTGRTWPVPLSAPAALIGGAGAPFTSRFRQFRRNPRRPARPVLQLDWCRHGHPEANSDIAER